MTSVTRAMRQLILAPDRGDIASIPADAVEHGEVFTRRWVVDLLLDLAGYTPDRDLASLVAVEPACGAGAFLGPIIERLSRACRGHGRDLTEASDAIRAFDLLPQNVEASQRLAEKILLDDGWPSSSVTTAVRTWITIGDYLLPEQEGKAADVVVGNPPYIRLEDVPNDRMSAYRKACPTMTGRSDIYVGFFELGLRSLKPGGVLAFICADRWMRNQYGRNLRQLVSDGYSMDVTIAMHDVDAFEEHVSAYPAITVLRRGTQSSAAVIDTTARFGPEDAAEVVDWVREDNAAPVTNDRCALARLPHWFDGGESWPTGSPARLALIEDLNDRFSPLEDPATGTRVGIGVATGADSVFVTKDADVEADRLLPLSMVRDTASGTVDWSGHSLVNPWAADGSLVDLTAYPKLHIYYQQNANVLLKRHIARKRPKDWYRTIDKVDHTLTGRPKLLFPDMRLTSRPVLDESGLYPHHNLYYVVSNAWDLRVLGGLLISGVAEAFVHAYAVKMRGGTLRFQAQYLRRIRVPHPDTLSTEDRTALAAAFDRRDTEAATVAALRVYGISDATGEWTGGSASVRTSRP